MISTSFGEKLKIVLAENKVTQKDLAKKLNIAPTTLNGYISDKREPDLETLKKIALSLGVTTDYLLECEDEGINLNAKEMALVWQLRKLTPSQRDVVVELLGVMTKKNKSQN
ncbi:MAG: helix-turn-helix transcriptional regulator [Clostridia bacterium]|nr:helix-turn-helix transcriptional regulator [Clostridia bacterium]